MSLVEVASSCSSLTTCSSCVQKNALVTILHGLSCFWCPLDDYGDRCHDIGAVETSKCYGVLKNTDCIASPTTDSTCPMKSPDFCPEAVPQVRVSMGMMSRPYGSVRVSLISPSAAAANVSGFEYNAPFKWAWTQLALSSSLVHVPAGSESFSVPFAWMHGRSNVTIRLPAQGAGTVGLLIADPCVSFGLGATPGFCDAGHRFRTAERIPEMTNALMADGTIRYWATLGDNWYDPKGDISQAVYARYSRATLSALNVAIPGNHDYWSLGPSIWPSPFGEQCGNGFLQWNGMDTLAAWHAGPGGAPYNLSVDPQIELGRVGQGARCVAAKENFNFYQQIGNVGVIGYTGASAYAELDTFFKEACAAVAAEPTVQVVLLVSHWDTAGGATGGAKDSTTPGAFSRVMKLAGCSAFHAKGMIKWVTGHTHCNTHRPYVDEWGAEVADAGFRVSGMGMAASGDTCRLDANGTSCPSCEAQPNFGFPIVDSTGSRLRVLYFATHDDARYDAVLGCVRQHGWRGCEKLASVWLDTPIVEREL